MYGFGARFCPSDGGVGGKNHDKTIADARTDARSKNMRESESKKAAFRTAFLKCFF